MWPVALAQLSFGGTAIDYVFPVLRMMSCFHITDPMMYHVFLASKVTLKSKPLHRFQPDFTQQLRPASVHHRLCTKSKRPVGRLPEPTR